MNKLTRAFVTFLSVLLLAVVTVSAQQNKIAEPYQYQPASAEATPSPSPSPSATPEVIERVVYVPVMPLRIQKEVAAVQTTQIQIQPVVPKTLVDEAKRLLSTQTVQSIQKDGNTVAAALIAPEGGYGFSSPPLVLEVNKNNFSRDETMQARLRVVNKVRNGQVYWFWVNINSLVPQFRFGNLGTKAFVPGETVPVKNYTWDGTEEQGTYIYGVFVTDNNGQITAEAVTNFMFGNGQPPSWYVRIDSAESVGGGWVHLRGNFFFSNFDPRFHQYVSANGQIFNVAFSTNTDAWTYVPLASGVYDLTWVAWYEGNQSYDSVTSPGALKIFSTSTPSGKG